MAKAKVDYKEALKKHLEKVPAYPKELLAGSPAYKKPIPPDQIAEIKKEGWKAAFDDTDFYKYTGLTHTSLVKNWANGGIQTSCNSFLTGCCTAMGAPNLGIFELEQHLASLGKSYTWVPATSGDRPGYGDVFRSQKYHMGLSLGFDGDTWLTVEGGQGGPNSTGIDSIKYKRQPFKPDELRGWCDMRAFLAPPPDWLPGWWVIYAGDQVFHYHFNARYGVSYMPWKPSGSTAPTAPTDTGTYAVEAGDGVVVNWRAEGGTERFRYDRFDSFPGIMERMTGVSNRNEPLKGVRI